MGLRLTIMKTINFKHINERIEKPVTDLPANSFEYYINLTAKLIDRPYMHTFKLVQGWPLDKISRRYEQATKHCPPKSTPELRWWALRKREMTNE